MVLRFALILVTCISAFSEIDPSRAVLLRKDKPFFGCYKSIFGVFSERKISRNTSFKEISIEKLEKKRNKLERRKKRKELKKVVKELKRYRSFEVLCTEKSFLGNKDSLKSYRNDISPDEVQYLLDKVAFGGNKRLLEIGIEKGLYELVDTLIDEVDNSYDEERLIQRLLHHNQEESVFLWHAEVAQIAEIYRAMYSSNPFRSWMTLLLAEHFSTSLSRTGAFSTSEHLNLKAHRDLLYNHSTGNFRNLVKQMLYDGSMNIWLDNFDNHIGRPNQNFARELLELFILGAVDPKTGQPNYDESSIVAATAFVSGFYGDYTNHLAIRYDPDLHDGESYPVFQGLPAYRNQSFEPEEFISFVMDSHPGSSRFIAERFGGRILYPGLSEKLVNKLASILVDHEFELKPFLRTILKSEAMFSPEARQPCIDAPIESFIRLVKKVFSDPVNIEKDDELYLLQAINYQSALSGQSIFDPPSVFSWKGACNLNRNGNVSSGEGWIQGQRTLSRFNGCAELMNILNWQERDFNVPTAITPRALGILLSRRIFGRIPSETELRAIERYLLRFGDDENGVYRTKLLLREEYYRRTKIPGLICALFVSPEVQ